MTALASAIDSLRHVQAIEPRGSVAAVRGLSILVNDLRLPIGTLVRVVADDRASTSMAIARGEIVGFDGSRSIVMLLSACDGLAPGAVVVGEPHAPAAVQVGQSLLGRVVDGLCRPIDGGGRMLGTRPQPLHAPPISALKRRRIDQPLATGVRAIDGMLTLGKGQRVGVFSAPGVGKSTLLATIARNTNADINVIALVGERGREVRDFLENALGADGLARSVVVVATGDQSPLLRVRAAMVACAVAEFFRDQGADVMLMMDSITRFAQAQRQIGLSVGEQPATKGYTPSVFAMLPMLLERAGAIEGGGSITGLYAVLVEGDDMNEPISDAARGVLDGHIALSRKLAGRGHYPAINVLDSISRVADDVCSAVHVEARRHLIKLIAAHAEIEELINIGAYARGSNSMCDVAIAMKPALDAFLQQNKLERSDFARTSASLIELSQVAQVQAAKAAPAARGSKAS